MGWSMWDNDYLREKEDDGMDQIKKEAPDIVKKIRDLKSRGTKITVSEGKLLREAEGKLIEMQEKCKHLWSTILLFNRHRQFCKWCDKENHSYTHKD